MGQDRPVVDPHGVLICDFEAERQHVDAALKTAEEVFRSAVAAASVPSERIAELAYPSLPAGAEASSADVIVLDGDPAPDLPRMHSGPLTSAKSS